MTRDDLVELIERKHGDLFRAVARSMAPTSEDAEDAYQSALLSTWKASPSVRDDVEARAYFYTALRNHVHRQARGRRRRPTTPLTDAVAARASDPADVPLIVEQREQIAGLRRLKFDRRAVLLLVGLGWSHAEIGAHLQLTPRQVRRRITNGNRDLGVAA